jgi:predicted transcriptional regulator
MSHTITIRLQDHLARWLEDKARETGVSKGRLIREQLERAKESDREGRSFMRLAGSLRGEPDLSMRKGFSRS